MIDLTPLIEAFIAVMAALIVRYFVPWLREHTSAAQREDFAYWTKIAVKAAEQIYDATQGHLKKQYVMKYLSDKGFSVDEADLNLSIEAAVLELHAGLHKESGHE